MDWDLYNQKIKVFLPECTTDTCEAQKELEHVLQLANIEVLKMEENNMQEANCSVHILGNDYEKYAGKDISKTEYWFDRAKEINAQNEKFSLFIWQPPFIHSSHKDNKQEEFINNIRNTIYQNMIFSNQESPVMLVEDMRSIIYAEQKNIFKTKDTDIYFIYNEIDEDFASDIMDMLSDVLRVEKTKIVMNSGVDYSETISRQILQSGLTVAYFNRTANWAVPFTQQIWKKIGGASANKQIMLIGDANVDQNQSIDFKAPNVSSRTINTELIPLEIKVMFDKVSSS